MVIIDNFFAYSLSGGSVSTEGTGTGTGGGQQVRLLAENVNAPSQAQLQAYYDAQAGVNAPDIVPIEVENADSSFTTGYAVYLGHDTWRFRENGTGSWSVFPSSKSDFGAVVARLYTFK